MDHLGAHYTGWGLLENLTNVGKLGDKRMEEALIFEDIIQLNKYELHEGTAHSHIHIHRNEHSHVHGSQENISPWVLFTIFVLGPCEPLIPLVIYPAAQSSLAGLLLVTAVFAVITIATMLAIVFLSVRGLALLPLRSFGRYMHALSGGTILLSGLAIKVLGL